MDSTTHGRRLGKHEYEDVTEHQPTDTEWESAEQEAPLPEPPLTRHRTKRPLTPVQQRDMEVDSTGNRDRSSVSSSLPSRGLAVTSQL